MSITFRRLRATTVTAALAAAALIAPAPSMAAVADPPVAAARYLQQQLIAGGHHLSTDFGGTLYADYGMTADAVLALDASGSAKTEADNAAAWLADNVINYTGFGDPNEIAAGAAAKLLNVAVAQGKSPTSFGGQDLVAMVSGRLQPSGRFADQSAWGDYSNTFGQSLAIMGLQRATGTVSPTALAYLLLQQCPGGGFQLFETDTECTDPTKADPDATAMAVQALIAAGGITPAVNAGLDYLASKQDAAGGVGGGGPQTSVNANSTGLAGQAFLAGGRRAQAALAASFVRSLQFDCSFPEALRGAIAYDQTRYDAAKAAGPGATTEDQDRRSTSQAALTLAGTPLYVVTSTGADAIAPALVCATPTPTPTPTVTPSPKVTATPTVTASAAAPAATSAPASSTPAPTVAARSTTRAELAYTGSNLLTPSLVAAGLLVAGVALLLMRRRGLRR